MPYMIVWIFYQHFIDITAFSLPSYVVNTLQNTVREDGAHGDTPRAAMAENFV